MSASFFVGAQKGLFDVARDDDDVAVVDQLQVVVDDPVEVDLGQVAAPVAQRVEHRVAADGLGSRVGAAAPVDHAIGGGRRAGRCVGRRVEQPDALEGDAEDSRTGALERLGGADGGRLGEGGHVVAQEGRHDALGAALGRWRLRGAALERLSHLHRVHRPPSLPVGVARSLRHRAAGAAV